MAMKIALQNHTTKKMEFIPGMEVVWDGLQQYAKKVVRPDTTVTQFWVEKGAIMTSPPFLKMLNDTETVKGALKAEAQGYDAVVMGCFGDPGVYQARSIVDIPVIGPCESSTMLANLMGIRFAVVTIGAGWVTLVERNLRDYGLEGREIKQTPVRYFDGVEKLTIEAFKGKPEALIEAFEKEALKSVADGADVVINGCAWAGPALTMAGYKYVGSTGVPVLDCAYAALKMAELMVDMRRTTGVIKSNGDHSPFQVPPKPLNIDSYKFVVDMTMKTFGIK